ncbi:MAG TPA: c-type cytochrome domain-containing protein [Vicinamibacterales bacterium]
MFFSCLAVGLLAAGCGDATDDRPARWSYISTAIIEPSCATASCHSEIAQRAGVNLYERVPAYKQLVTERHFVVPGSPDTSALVKMLRAQPVRRMPPDYALPESDIALIEKWITMGAKND